VSKPSWSLSHRQLVSAIVALALPGGGLHPTPFADLGFELVALELPMVDDHGRPYQLDVLLASDARNLSLLLECKTWAEMVDADQVGKYMATTGRQVIQQSGLVSSEPRRHRADVVFVVLPGVEGVVARLVGECNDVRVEGWALVRVAQRRVELVHDELADEILSQALGVGWDVDIERLPLERLPFEPDSPRWELADVVLQTIFSFFAGGRREFGIDEVCSESNGLWAYLESQHAHIRQRVRDEVRTLRRTALSGWIGVVATGTGREERWRFSRRSTNNVRTVGAYRVRHQRYVSILRDERRDPVKADFVKIAPEQLSLSFIVDGP
jgi:hypothetical protein